MSATWHTTAHRMSSDQRRFLHAHRRYGSVTCASRSTGISRSQHYGWLKRSTGYREAFDAGDTAAKVRQRRARSRARSDERIGPETRARQDRFLSAYRECAVVSYAAAAAGIGRRTHYNWLNNDPEYCSRFQDAREDAADRIELELWHRAIEGYEEPVIYQGKVMYLNDADGSTVLDDDGQPIPLTVKRHQPGLLMFLAKALKPAVYGNQQHSIEIEDRRTRNEQAADLIRQAERMLGINRDPCDTEDES